MGLGEWRSDQDAHGERATGKDPEAQAGLNLLPPVSFHMREAPYGPRASASLPAQTSGDTWQKTESF